MAVTIDATVGGASANSFALLAAASAYAEGKFPAPTTWTAASDDDKNRALVSATRWLSSLEWVGAQVDTTQALAWPRQEAPNPVDPNGFDYETTVIPQPIVDATCELALAFVAAGSTDIAALPRTDGVIRKKVDVLETEYAAPYLQAKALDRYPSVKRLIAPLLASGGSSVTTTLVRG
jgi:hypothetical protein